jgi:hypothetical protein
LYFFVLSLSCPYNLVSRSSYNFSVQPYRHAALAVNGITTLQSKTPSVPVLARSFPLQPHPRIPPLPHRAPVRPPVSADPRDSTSPIPHHRPSTASPASRWSRSAARPFPSSSAEASSPRRPSSDSHANVLAHPRPRDEGNGARSSPSPTAGAGGTSSAPIHPPSSSPVPTACSNRARAAGETVPHGVWRDRVRLRRRTGACLRR